MSKFHFKGSNVQVVQHQNTTLQLQQQNNYNTIAFKTTIENITQKTIKKPLQYDVLATCILRNKILNALETANCPVLNSIACSCHFPLYYSSLLT